MEKIWGKNYPISYDKYSTHVVCSVVFGLFFRVSFRVFFRFLTVVASFARSFITYSVSTTWLILMFRFSALFGDRSFPLPLCTLFSTLTTAGLNTIIIDSVSTTWLILIFRFSAFFWRLFLSSATLHTCSSCP